MNRKFVLLLTGMMVFMALQGYSAIKSPVTGTVVISNNEIKSKDSIPQIAVIDVITASYDANKIRVMTDYFRSELFRTQLFKIVERGMIQQIMDEHKLKLSGLTLDSDLLQVGKLLSVEKVFVCTMEKFGDTINVNVRIIDMNSSLIDFTDSIFVKSEGQLFEALKEIVVKIELFYAARLEKAGLSQQSETADTIKKKWSLVGATPDEISYLVSNNVPVEDYLSLRQYDITFTAKNFVAAHKNGWDVSIIKSFFQAGINYNLVGKAMGMGVIKLDSYKDTFKHAGYSFEEYLEAYENHITNPQEYAEYKEGFRQNRSIFGIGGVADSFPIANAEFKFMVASISWEHFWTKYQRNWYKLSSNVGMYLMNAVIPVPFAEGCAYFGYYPYYFKIALGGHAELMVGGHFAANLKLGFELLEKYEVTIFTVFTGTQPNVSYTDLSSKIDDPSYIPIKYPYYGLMFSYKF